MSIIGRLGDDRILPTYHVKCLPLACKELLFGLFDNQIKEMDMRRISLICLLLVAGGWVVRAQDGRPSGSVAWSGPITSRASDKCLDVANYGQGRKANIQQWSCAGQNNQLWDIVTVGNGLYAIYSVASGMVLDVEGESRRNGANVQQFRWNSGGNQKWRISRVSGDYYQIINARSGKCLDLANGSDADGANIQQWSCARQRNQQWRLRRR
jgi:hypothetical protein